MSPTSTIATVIRDPPAARSRYSGRMSDPRLRFVMAAVLFGPGCPGVDPPGGSATTTATTGDGATTPDDPTGGTWIGGTSEGTGSSTGGDPCPDDAPGEPVAVHGIAEKGPFAAGAAVTISVLDALGEPTGEVHASATVDAFGSFVVPDVPRGPVLVRVEGAFHDELHATAAGPPVALQALQRADPDTTSHVNVVTHLAADRARSLLADGACLADALAQAEAEVVGVLLTGNGTPQQLSVPAAQTSVVGADEFDNAYVLALGVVLMIKAEQTGAPLQQLLDDLAADFAADGTVDVFDPKYSLHSPTKAVPVDLVHSQIADFLVAHGAPPVVPNMYRVLDQDGDSFVELADNCPNVENWQQYDSDADGIGDSCDCGDVMCDCGFDAPDADGDDYPDACDNCPAVVNDSPPQDAIGGEDTDLDDDGLGNACDSCPRSPGVGAVPGENCCDPRGGGVCVKDWQSIVHWHCAPSGPKFACAPVVCASQPTAGRPCSCEAGPCVPPGGIVATCPEGQCECDTQWCDTQYCTVGDDTCGPGNTCLAWYAPGDAPPGLEALGACARTDQGPCAAGLASDCVGAP